MKRMHIHVGVKNLDESVQFYSALFGAAPEKTKPDYARWMLDDPRVNFAISTHAKTTGVDHLGLQVNDAAELGELRDRLKQADMSIIDQGETVCCYARSDKSWVQDPSGVAWEAFNSMEDVQIFGSNDVADDKACCAPQAETPSECCVPS